MSEMAEASPAACGEQLAGGAARYVVQHHVLSIDDEHWDLMLERGGTLWTWSLPAPPDRPDALPACAVRLADHRAAYLDYEGPVSGDRGRVEIHDRGTLRWVGQPPVASDLAETLTVELEGEHLRGRYELTLTPREGKDLWRLRRLG